MRHDRGMQKRLHESGRDCIMDEYYKFYNNIWCQYVWQFQKIARNIWTIWISSNVDNACTAPFSLRRCLVELYSNLTKYFDVRSGEFKRRLTWSKDNFWGNWSNVLNQVSCLLHMHKRNKHEQKGLEYQHKHIAKHNKLIPRDITRNLTSRYTIVPQ